MWMFFYHEHLSYIEYTPLPKAIYTLPLNSSFNVSYLSGLSQALTLGRRSAHQHILLVPVHECLPVIEIPIWKASRQSYRFVGYTQYEKLTEIRNRLFRQIKIKVAEILHH